MRFDRLEIEAFGHFTNYSIPFDQGHSFHVLYGNNEAGKSTLLRSITQLLYGIPHNSKDSFLHPNTKLRIGGTISNAAGDTIKFYRRKGKTKTLLDENGEAIPDNSLVPYINVLSEDTFRSMFALNHETLREGGEALLASNGHVGESLFAAASGINAIKQVMGQLDSASKELYKAGGSKPPINELIRKEKELTKKANESLMLARRWKELEKEYTDGKAVISELREKQAQVSARINKLEKLRKASPKLAERKLLLDKLAPYESIPTLPHDCSLQRRELSKIIRSCAETAQTAKAEADKLKEKLAQLSVDENILKEESVIQSLNGDIGAYEKEKRDYENLKERAEVCRKQLDDLLQNMGFMSMEAVEMENLRIQPARKEKIRSLHENHRILKSSISDLRQRITAMEEVVSLKKQEWENYGELHSLDDLQAALAAAHDEGKLEDRIAELQAELKDMQDSIDEQLKILPLWNGGRTEFAGLHIPILEETIEQFMKEEKTYKEDVLAWKQKFVTEEELLSSARAALRDLEASTVIPTEENLKEARRNRDESWKLVRRTLDGQKLTEAEIARYAGENKLADIYESQLEKADELADVMRHESAKVGMKQKYLNDIDEAVNRMEGYKRKLEHLDDVGRQLYGKWNALWQENGITPLSPQEMKAWMSKYREIKYLLSQCQKKEHACSKLNEQSQLLKKRLYDALASVTKLNVSYQDYSLARWIKEATVFKDKESARSLEKQALESDWKNKRIALLEMENELKEKNRQYVDWKDEWAEAVCPIQLDGTCPTDTALERVERYDRCVKLYDEWVELSARMNASRMFVQDFEQKIGYLLDQVNWPKQGNIQSLVYKLADELKKQLQNKRDKEDWNRQLEECLAGYETASQKQQAAAESLCGLLSLAGVQTVDELQAVEEQYAAKQDLTRRINELDLVLQEIAGSGSIDELEQEIAEQDMEHLEGHLTELELEQKELDENCSAAYQSFGVCKKEYEEKIHGSSVTSVMATEERESVIADLSALCEQYVEKRLAVMILQKGIEYYRAQNQNPILTRASTLFARLTEYSFEGLTVDYNEKDEEVLLGIRNGEKIGIDAMSDGTMDQLYLALRVASIEKYCEDNEPVPFIVDDILVHFDNKRSKVTLEVLAELSKATQIIFFTHHAHLVELIEDTLNETDYQFIEINKEAVMQG